MAYITNTNLTEGLRARIDRAWNRIMTWAENHAEMRARIARIDSLEALSDADLARRGLTRDQIVAHVFRDRMFY